MDSRKDEQQFLVDKVWERINEEARCPSCGRFVGPYERCPYCGASLKKRTSLKILKYGSLIFSVLGLIIVYVFALMKPIPLVKVEQVNPSMNFAKVKMKGVLYKYPVLSEMEGRLYLYLSDGTGTFRVRAFGKTAKEAIKKLRGIKIGDELTAVGKLTVDYRGVQLDLERVDLLSWRRIAPVPVDPSGLENMVERKVVFTGEVQSVKKFADAFSMVVDGARIFYDSSRLGKPAYVPSPGDKIKVVGFVWSYRGVITVYPVDSSSIKLIRKARKRPSVVPLSYDHISSPEKYRGKMVSFSGEVISIKELPKLYLISLDTDLGRIKVVVFKNEPGASGIAEDLSEGTSVKGVGKVDVYKGEFEIVAKKLYVVGSSSSLYQRSLADESMAVVFDAYREGFRC